MGRLIDICGALGLEFYIGPKRSPKAAKTPPQLQLSPPSVPDSASASPVRHRALAELQSPLRQGRRAKRS